MSVTTSKFENCCPSCTAMMAIRVGRLTKARAEALDCPSARLDPFVGQELLMCWHCGNVAPKTAWDSIDNFDEWRQIFASGIVAYNRTETREHMAQNLRAEAEHLQKRADELIAPERVDYGLGDEAAPDAPIFFTPSTDDESTADKNAARDEALGVDVDF